MFSPFCLVWLVKNISLVSLWRVSSVSVSQQFCPVCLSVTLAAFHTSALKWQLNCLQVIMDEQLWLLQFPGEVVDCPCQKLELFFTEKGQQHALVYTWYLFSHSHPAHYQAGLETFCAFDKTLSVKIMVLRRAKLILVWWWDSDVSLGKLQDAPPETTNQQESKITCLLECGYIF